MRQINLQKIDWKTIAIIILVIIAILSFGTCVHKSNELSDYTNEKKVDTLSVKKWIDKYNQEHTLVKQNEINHANLISAKDGEIAILRQDLAKDKNIVGKTIIHSKTTGKIVAKIEEIPIIPTDSTSTPTDTINKPVKRIFSYKDKFLTMQGEILADSVSIDYSLKNEYDIFTKTKNNGWFKKNTTEVELVNKNPNTTTDKIQVFVLSPPPKKFHETRAFNMIIGAAIGGWGVHQLSK